MSKVKFESINGMFAREAMDVKAWGIAAGQLSDLKREWSEVGVLVLRRQSLTERELIDFSANFGEAEVVIRTDWLSRQNPEITIISNLKDEHNQPIGMPGSQELHWHSDQSYMPNPATGAILYAVEVPATGGCTYWASLRLAYDALPDRLKRSLENKRAIYDYAERLRSYDAKMRVVSDDVKKNMPPQISHRLVNRHPVSGLKCLYFDPSTTVGIEGMGDAEGRDLLNELKAIATRPEFVYRHDWRPGDVVMWDNGFLLHRRDDYDSADRGF